LCKFICHFWIFSPTPLHVLWILVNPQLCDTKYNSENIAALQPRYIRVENNNLLTCHYGINSWSQRFQVH
jgi:hypothetical protein